VLTCASGLTCADLAQHVASSGAAGPCQAQQAAYAGAPACALPAICSAACARRDTCAAPDGGRPCVVRCAYNLNLAAASISEFCTSALTAFYTCATAADCAALTAGTACAMEEDVLVAEGCP